MSTLEIVDAGPMRLPLAELRIDPELQCRASGINKATVREYADAMREGAAFPAVVVFRDSKGVHWLADGFHRCAALALVDETAEIVVDVREGSRRDALLFASGANNSHGLKRTNADRRKSALMLLNDPTWGKRSDTWIAKAAAVSQPFVSKLRMTQNVMSDGPRETADGRVMDTSSIGARKPSADPTDVALAKFKALLALLPDGERARFAELVLAMLTAPGEEPAR